MWSLFRVENEHCTNVGRFRASRDVPLPYDIPSPKPSSSNEDSSRYQDGNEPPNPRQSQRRTSTQQPPQSPAYTASGVDVETAQSPSLRRRPTVTASTPIQRGIARVATIMTQAHAQDFERKRRPGVVDEDAKYREGRQGESSEEEDDEEDGTARDDRQDVLDAEGILERHRNGTDSS